MTKKKTCVIFVLATKINITEGSMNDVLSFIKLTQKIQYRISANDKKPKSFGTRHKLYQSEIHFIDAIGLDGGYSASELSEKLGVTNGAVTQVSDKLLKKKLIENMATKKQCILSSPTKAPSLIKLTKNFMRILTPNLYRI